MSGARILPANNSHGFIIIPENALLVPTPLSPRYNNNIGLVNLPPFSPVLSPVAPVLGVPGVPVMSPSHVIPGVPGAFVVATSPVAGSPAPASATGTPTNYTVITPPITNIRHITSPDSDPELRRKVIKHFYNELKEIYFLEKFKKLLKYIVVENNKARLVKSYDELQKNVNNNNDSNLRIKFITDEIFSKYDLEILISKLIAKYGMLYSEDEYNLHWYNAKYRHKNIIKKAIYKKIKYRLQKKVKF